MTPGTESNLDGIAIVGLAGRFPGARDVAQFWKNLAGGVESIRFFSDDDFRRAGLDPTLLAQEPDFVRARSVMDGVDLFDASFFGIDAREAELMDPQHRVFIEVAWEALENAGCDPGRYAGAIGLFAGLSLNTYLLANLCSDRQYIENLVTSYQLGEFQTILGNDKDFLTTRAAYKLNLRGPVMTVQTACSTSLVAVAQACQSLQNFQCDAALAGAISITFPQIRGYRYQEGAMGSADGHCRTFDAGAQGTVFGDGCGIVVLKRLADAIAGRDCIRAVIKGAAINNDGAAKVSYTAPSVEGQAEVIAAAQALAGVEPESISYIEAHGTATPLGDPIEIAALTQAFRTGTDKRQFCAIGSAKTNFGHLDVASGVTGLIKTTLALEHELIPPSLHFKRANPQIDFDDSPFFVNTEARAWKSNGRPRRAGVSSFGVGGTNAHVILEEAPPLPARPEAGPQILVLSTKTRPALDLATEALAVHLESNPGIDLRDAAFTLQTGRGHFDFRRFVICDTVAEAIQLLRNPDPARVFFRGGRLPAGDTLLIAAGRNWLMAQPVDWLGLHGDTQPRRIPLPSYPFERQRYWIEPPQRQLTAEPAPVNPVLTGDSILTSSASRKDRIIAEVKAVFTELSGENLSTADPAVSFFDIGLDSLFLTQAAQSLRKKFNIKITFRQLLDDLSTLGSLTAYIDSKLPADQYQPLATIAAPVQAATATPLDRMTQQLAEIAKQIEALRSGAPAAPTPSPTPALPSPPAEPKRFGPYKPIDRSASTGFTPEQQKHLDALIARYTERTPNSKAFTQEHRAHFADPRAVAGFRPFWKEMVYPIVAQRSSGARIWDIDGNEYVDVTMGFGTNLFGHSPEFINEAVRRQLESGIEVGPSSKLAGEAAELFCELTGNERVTFCSTGSEAVLGAIRLARTVTGRTKIATTSEAYHGICDEVLVRGAGGRPVPIAPGIPAHAVSEVLVIEWGNPASLDLLRAHAHELAAVLVESIQSRRPEIQPVDFIREIRRITRESGTAFILDEVITGFRAHPGGVQALWDIRADLATYGKVIGGGMPIGAIGGRAEYMDALDGGPWQYGDASFPEVGVTFFAGTYVRHPLAMAAAKAVLEHIRDAGPGLQRELAARTDRFTTELNAFFEAEGAPVRATHFTSMMYFQFGEAFRHPGLLFFHLRAKGLHIWEGRPWFLSTAHTESDVEFILATFRETILELKQAGFFAGEAAPLPAPRLIQAVPAPARIAIPEPAAPAPAVSSFITHHSSFSSPPLFSVYFFGSYPAEYSAAKYRLLIEGTKLADARGFHAVWLPERHFHTVGGFSPNPSLLAAALARETSQIRLHGGSVVVPLHHPVRIAEEWSVVDNLSNGRAGISFASGWHPNDFIFAPGNFEKRRELYYEGIEIVRRLWRGESASFQTGGATRLDVHIHPRPRQAELPTWFTCIHKDAFIKAGELGANILCHTVNQSLDEIAGKIAAYREARARSGFDPGHVTLLVHTFLGANAAEAIEQARRPFYDYLTAFLDNGKKKVESHGRHIEVAQEDMDEILGRSYQDYVENKALIGSIESCAPVIEKLTAIGVDELGCFIDFGVDPGAALSSLARVATLKEQTESRFSPAATSRPAAPACLPLPSAERGLWTLINTGENAARVYNESITLSLRGPTNLDALRQTLQFLVDRHEGLRAMVSPDGDSQRIAADCPIDFEIRDFSHGYNGTRDTGIRNFFAEREAALFDFSRPPLLRASLATLGDREHLLLLTFHHLTGNGPSYTMLLDELAAAYDAISRGDTPRLAPALQLHDFVAWRVAQVANQDDSARFWLDQFQGQVPVLDLPADHSRPAIQTFRGGRQIITIDEALTKSVKAAAAGQRCSLFMLLFTAYGVLLNRLSSQDDLVIGVAADAEIRTEEGGHALYANTTHMMPLRCRFAENAAFSDQVRASKKLILDASEHQQYFFGDLIGRLHLPRNLSRSPLFSVTFNLETGEFRKRAGGVDFEWATDPQPYRSPADTAMFDLYMNIAERNGGLLCELDHSEIYDPETVRRWLGHFRALLEQIARNPATPLSSLVLAGAPENARGTDESNGAERPYPAGALLHELVAQQVARTPDAVAITRGAESLTYAEMDNRAENIARHLRSLGVRRDIPVAVCLERSLDLPVALLAVLKAGGAYVPIDPSYPAERVRYMLRDSTAPIALATEEIAARFRQPGGASFISPSAAAASSVQSSIIDHQSPISSEDLAYILYTSGSTGAPKGSMISHRAICNHMFWMREEFPLTGSDRVLQKTPTPFDASVWEFWAPLIAGARLVMAPPGVHRDSRELANLVESEGITILQLVPSMAALVAEEPALPSCKTLRRLFCGGEPLPPNLCEKFFARLPGCELINLYGPTECAIDTVFHRCRPGARSVPIGRPVANTRLHVLDPAGAPVAPGGRGELYIAGAQVGRGYWNKPSLTESRFVEIRGERMYKTGDLVRWNEEHELEYLGRSDDQIKIRGHRIEPAEIETALRRQAGVRDCAVIAREDESGGKRLVAYVVPERADRIDLWPSSPSAGGLQFFDDALYHAMTNDKVRNDSFREALARIVRDRIVVDIGTGKDAILARLCIEAGARKVYAVEIVDSVAAQARQLVAKLRLSERIVVVEGDSRTVQLPEKADVCVSENIGHIGGAEGWDLVLAKSAHLLKPDAPIIPERCETLAAAVSLPAEFMRNPKFSELSAYYAENLFDQAGYQFDLRLSITGTGRANLSSNIGVFEDIDFKAPLPWYSRPLRLTIEKTSTIHGFLLWVRLQMAPGIVLDTLDHQASWLPVFLPVFPAGLAVNEDDVIEAEVTGALAENGLNRDYVIHGTVVRPGRAAEPFDFTSWHYKRLFQATPFYKTLFASGSIPVAETPRLFSRSSLAEALGEALPPFMVPSAFVVLPELPLMPNGKLDRRSLPPPTVSSAPGHRPVSPGDIEALEGLLKRQPGIADCAAVVRADATGAHQLVAYVTQDRSDEMILWPSSLSAGAERLFDPAFYSALTNDPARNNAFLAAFEHTVRGKVAIDVGTGRDAILARLCIEAGAKKVYGVELLESAAEQARELVRKLDLEDRITILAGDIRTLRLPEQPEVLVSENIGHVGGAEGWDLTLAKGFHLLKPDAAMVPARCITRMAAVSLPADFTRSPRFSDLSAYYASGVFRHAGYQFDLRLCITGVGRGHLRSTDGVFEEIDFHKPVPGSTQNTRLAITADSNIDGFLLWLNIELAPGVVFDTFEHQQLWLPVFLPVFGDGLEVREGDAIDCEVTSTLAENGRNRDYLIAGSVLRDGRGIRDFSFHSYHYRQSFKATPFYQRLFASGDLPVAETPTLAIDALAQALAAAIPAAAVPSAFIPVPKLLRLPNGLLDLDALPAPQPSTHPASASLSAASLTPLQREIAEIWRAVLGAKQVGLQDNFFEIGGDSLSGLRVVNRLRTALNEHVSLVVIFEAPTVERLSTLLEHNYAESVHRWLGVKAAAAAEAASRISEADISTIRALITPMRKYPGASSKNPAAVFILSPMRSGSTLLRIMLAGNPALFAPPELQLLGFETLAERKTAFTGYDKYLHEGVIRAIMEIRQCDAAEAESIIAGLEREGGGVKEFYGRVQEWIAPRMLVDKTPDYAMDLQVLRRAEEIFEDPLYIHLARHPLAMIRSYEKGRFILESPYRGRHSFTARQLGELTWLVSHRNILEFLRTVPQHRQHRVRFEDLISKPEPILASLCQWLEIPFVAEMADPYDGDSQRMTDGIHPMSPQVGDANFYQHGRLNPEVAGSWKSSYTEDFLSPLTWELAGAFGYANPFATNTAAPTQPIARLSRDQRVPRPAS